ncbi:hypothetical protein [Mycobacteroides franklinii]|nr:hypothetical protein [Mycobacteroides franklinii]
MTTNDQPSPTDPTPTPHSEPESSTGPDQLEWTEPKPSVFHADTKGGRYVVYDRSLYSSTGWMTVYLQDRGLPTAHLYKGHSEAEARAAAQAHHNTMIRRLAWEQYMRDNDPPRPRKLGCCNGGPQWGHAWTCPTLP